MAKAKQPTQPSPDILDEIAGLPDSFDLKKTEKDLKKKVQIYEELISRQAEQIKYLSANKFEIPTQGKQRKERGGFVRVVIPDTHGCFIDWSAVNAMLADISLLNPKEIVCLGDHLDCGGFLAEHHVWGYVAEADYTYKEDIAQANLFFDKLQAVAPKATIHYLQGNHERRVETWCMTRALRSKQDAQFLLDAVGPRGMLHIEKRGIYMYDQGKKYMNLSVPATIKLGHCYFTHGSRHGKNAASEMLRRFCGNVVFGHVHKKLMASDALVRVGDVCAWCPGSLCQRQPLWKHTDPSDWTSGYGVQLVRPSGDFLHINVPINDGHSYMSLLTKWVSR